VTIALPFKVVFFVLVDGWHLLAGTLIESFKPAL
jgi:flagellar biosynthetic protein FliP